MADAGVLGQDDRVELLEGEIVEMEPIGARHNACVDRLARLFHAQVGDLGIVRVHGSITLSGRSEPQPDVALLRWRDDFYGEALPGPSDVRLVVEVAEASAETDRDKAMAYGRAGIGQAWVVDLRAGHIEDYLDPTPGGYGYSHIHQLGDRVLVAALPQVEIEVAAILR
jgi:Uma2 family endonuclease